MLNSVCKKNILQSQKGALWDTLKWHKRGGIRVSHNNDYNDDCVFHILPSKAIFLPVATFRMVFMHGISRHRFQSGNLDHATSGLIAYLLHCVWRILVVYWIIDCMAPGHVKLMGSGSMIFSTMIVKSTNRIEVSAKWPVVAFGVVAVRFAKIDVYCMVAFFVG